MTPDGVHTITGAADGSLTIWKSRTGVRVHFIEKCEWPISELAVTPQSDRFLSGSWDRVLRVWEIESGRPVAELDAGANVIDAIAVHPEGRYVFAGGRIVEPTSSEYESLVRSGRQLPGVFRVEPGWDYDEMAEAHRRLEQARHVQAWDLDGGEFVGAYENHDTPVKTLCCSVDGRGLLAGLGEGSLAYWVFNSGRRPTILWEYGQDVIDATLSPDTRFAVSGCWDGCARVWRIERCACIQRVRGHSGPVAHVRLTTHGRRLVTGSWDGTARFWDLEKGKHISVLEGHTDAVTGLSIIHEDQRLVTCSSDGTVRLWDLESGDEVAHYTGLESFRCLGVTPDHEVAVVGDARGDVTFLSLNEDGISPLPPSGRVPFELPFHPTTATWHPTRSILAVGGASGEVRVLEWHPESAFLEEVRAFVTNGEVSSLKWSTDGLSVFWSTTSSTGTFSLDPNKKPSKTGWGSESTASADGRWRVELLPDGIEIVVKRP